MFRVIVKRPGVVVGSKGYRKQTIGVFLVDKDGVEDDFPTPVGLLHGPEDKDYEPGTYTISPASFGISGDKYGNTSFTVKRLHLVPAQAAAGRKAA